ncbi:MAG: hypothetical protein BGO51_25625 [Rhodospirillales bacterium 69-11]|nr:MAG: hypothetical protein BGO51_25625 [Rhodospirillales bacterium 69-11]
MIFTAPWVLAALAVLPLLWWLLRVTPPAPRAETFPAIRLLLGLRAAEETPARTPWWLLLLRVAAAALVILALSGPVLDAGARLAGSGPVLLVVDNGWAAAPDWPKRMQAAEGVLDRAAREGRRVALLATAPDGAGTAPQATPVMPVPDLRARLAALHPEPWPPDRAAATAALRRWKAEDASVVYLADGLTHGGDFPRFADAIAAIGPVTEFCCDTAPARVLLPPTSEADKLVARVAQAPSNAPSQMAVLAQSGDGRSLARAVIDLPAGAATGSAAIALPPELRNRLSRLVLEGPPSAGAVLLLDERWRRRPVGLLAGEQTTADTPFSGPLYFLRRALQPFTELREADATTLLSRDLSVMILADRPLPPGPERDAIAAWVDKGGLLIRFAGPRMAEATGGAGAGGSVDDDLLPVRLLGGDRQLGGALSWNEPASLAPFPPGSPFAGLVAPQEVKVTRQVLAEPSADLASHTWATLADGTPLVTEATRGAGRIVLFHTTANADWSNLPLSGLFVDMLRRLVALSAGVASAADGTVLSPAETLDGFGQMTQPPPAATGLAADAFGKTPVSPRHPPGLYGPENGRHALNLGATLPLPEAAPLLSGARVESLGTTVPERSLGPPLLVLAILLLAVDLVVSLALRGLLRARVAAAVLAIGLFAAGPGHALETNPNPALATRLGYILTGDAQVDAISKAGLEGLSDYVNRRTAAVLVEPDPITPGTTDLSFYPLLYWPITADAQPLSDTQAAALNDYMSRGGIILIDTRDSGSGAGFAPGTDSALRRVGQDLLVPPLAPLTTDHVLARSFYLLSDFPGRFTGDTVWVQRDQDRTNDSVSPVIIGGNDWAAAWAVDSAGRNPYAVIPGGQRQRTLAYRFGVNLVMYALTGNYKGDQVHVPAILQRLGQ